MINSNRLTVAVAYYLPFARLLLRIEVENRHFLLLYSDSRDPSRGTTTIYM